jgi:hypothetical protein
MMMIHFLLAKIQLYSEPIIKSTIFFESVKAKNIFMGTRGQGDSLFLAYPPKRILMIDNVSIIIEYSKLSI